jgi:hypothetical protein
MKMEPPASPACTNQSAPMVERLMAAGANANATLSNGETVLMNCVRVRADFQCTSLGESRGAGRADGWVSTRELSASAPVYRRARPAYRMLPGPIAPDSLIVAFCFCTMAATSASSFFAS